MSETISHKALAGLVDAWLAQGKHTVAPVTVDNGAVLYKPVASAAEVTLSGFVHPVNSIKEFLFPKSEKIYTYRIQGNKIALEDFNPDVKEQVILGARPCDAASLPVLDKVFNWDFKDKFFNARRAATTVITLGCNEWDDNCFCTTVGIGPAAEQGSDVLLLPIDAETYEVRCLTDKGKALFAGQTQSGKATAPKADGPAKKFDTEALHAQLSAHFDDPAWKEAVLRCISCGACAYVCPTCHCFDIVDEGDAVHGSRVKNWDSCQFPMFTMHASGHNPRATSAQRQRQRIQHKFRIYKDKFGDILCTGCGNCTRQCAVNLGVLNTILDFQEAAARLGKE